MADEYTKDKRYRIMHYIQKDTGSYFESDTTWYWEVWDTKNKEMIIMFVESDFANASGRQQSGAKLVKFSPDEKFVLVNYHDGTSAKIPYKTKLLPEKNLSNKNKTFTLEMKQSLNDEGSVDTIWTLRNQDHQYFDTYIGQEINGKKTGTKSARFSADGKQLLVEDHDGTKSTVDLK